MAGGTFDIAVGKDRPGTYINFESTRRDLIRTGERGNVLLPLIGHSYGPEKQFITLENSAPDAARELLGFSVYDDNPVMLLIREAFKNARRVIVYIPKQGAKAKKTEGTLTATAKHGGSRGNDLKFSVVANPLGGFDVGVYLAEQTMAEYSGLETVAELIEQDNAWIDFMGTGNLTEIAGASLSGGADGALVAGDIADFLDASEAVKWNTMAFPLEATGESGDPVPALQTAVLTKIKYLREDAGKYRKAVVANMAGQPNYEGVINVTNSVNLGAAALTAAQVTAWVAGIDCGVSNTTSNTYARYSGATGIVGVKSHAEAVAAINNGEFFFTFSEENEVVVEYDINSLLDFHSPRDRTYRKNRVIRVHDTFSEMLMANFPPNRFDNSPTGWDIMEGLGKAILKLFFDAGAIKNVDYDNDFLVDREQSTGDETYFNIGLEAVDSAEKLFFTIKTR
jgi:hypothetical protein